MLAVMFSYAIYPRCVERRRVSELSVADASKELAAGLLIGGAMVSTANGCLALLGAYTVTGFTAVGLRLVVGLATMAFVGVFEKVLTRAIVFRLTESSLGTLAALVISSLLFGLAHCDDGSDRSGRQCEADLAKHVWHHFEPLHRAVYNHETSFSSGCSGNSSHQRLASQPKSSQR